MCSSPLANGSNSKSATAMSQYIKSKMEMAEGWFSDRSSKEPCPRKDRGHDEANFSCDGIDIHPRSSLISF